MATHNQVRLIGYLLSDPKILNEGKIGEEKVLMKIRTARREIKGVEEEKFSDLLIYYSDEELMSKLKVCKQFDILDIKGVFTVLPTNKKSVCPTCGAVNHKENAVTTFVNPISVSRIGSYQDYYNEKQESPDSILWKNYRENSNQVLIIGTLVTDPQYIETKKSKLCRYGLGVNRKYFIKSQPEQHADYPWVYSYGDQAESDGKYLQKGAEVLVDGYIHNENAVSRMVCEGCNTEYSYPDVGTQFTPYAIEYLNGHKTDEDIEKEAKAKEYMEKYGHLAE